MEQSMRRFMKVGIILHVSYPQLGGGGDLSWNAWSGSAGMIILKPWRWPK